MTTNEFEIYITQTEQGEFLAASIAVPRFCVSSDTEDAAVELAREAWAYYRATYGHGVAMKRPRKPNPMARALRDKAWRKRVVESKKVYRRKGRRNDRSTDNRTSRGDHQSD